MRLSQAINNFRDHLSVERSDATTKGYYGDLMRFCLYMHDPLITQVHAEHVTAYLKESLALGWKRNSLVATSMALRKFFEYWKRKNYSVLDYQQLPVIQREGVEPRVATEDVFRKVLEQCTGTSIYEVRNRAILLLLADTGMRNGELCSMNIDVVEKVEWYKTVIGADTLMRVRAGSNMAPYEGETIEQWMLKTLSDMEKEGARVERDAILLEANRFATIEGFTSFIRSRSRA